jgi:diguanylate cyclase (GGDEF)-like protein
VVLLDAEMPGMSGFQVCEAMKAEQRLADVPIIFVTTHSEAAFEVAGFAIGAADFIAKPVSAPLVVARVNAQLRIKRMADELRRIAMVDVLTGLANRRSFAESLEREWRCARRFATPLALIMVDIDHFKQFNDRYGHPAGDACLRSVAHALLLSCLRPGDVVARYGGEEFVVILPRTPRAGAEQMAQRILESIEALGIAHEASFTARHVTVSVGIGCFDEASVCWTVPSPKSRDSVIARPGCSPVELVQAADRAMYSAKSAGRAQAKLLDIADVDSPQRARDIGPSAIQSTAPCELAV